MEISSQTTPRLLMSLIGDLASLEKTITMGRLHMRPFQWYLQWWKNKKKKLKMGCPLHQQEHNTHIFTDASNQGWGAHLENMTVSGTCWNQEKTLRINVLELKAVFLTLKRFQNKILNKRILIITVTVVSYLNKWGYTLMGHVSPSLVHLGLLQSSKYSQKSQTYSGLPQCHSRQPPERTK